MSNLAVHPAEIPEWEGEDILSDFLGTPAVLASEDETRAMLDSITVKLPDEAFFQRLKNVAPNASVAAAPIAADTKKFDFYVFQVTPSILIPDGSRLARLRVRLEIATTGGNATAWDLFPPDQWDVTRVDLAEAKVDVSKALMFVCPAAADCLGLKLDIPIHWYRHTAKIRTSDRMSNPVEWYVTDDSVQNGFCGTVIIRVPKKGSLSIAASIAGELRKTNLLGKILKGRFITDAKQYALSA